MIKRHALLCKTTIVNITVGCLNKILLQNKFYYFYGTCVFFNEPRPKANSNLFVAKEICLTRFPIEMRLFFLDRRHFSKGNVCIALKKGFIKIKCVLNDENLTDVQNTGLPPIFNG